MKEILLKSKTMNALITELEEWTEVHAAKVKREVSHLSKAVLSPYVVF